MGEVNGRRPRWRERPPTEAALLFGFECREPMIALPKLDGVAVYQRLGLFPSRAVVGADQVYALRDVPVPAYDISLILSHLAAPLPQPMGLLGAHPEPIARNSGTTGMSFRGTPPSVSLALPEQHKDPAADQDDRSDQPEPEVQGVTVH
jgi:hypothetical protein